VSLLAKSYLGMSASLSVDIHGCSLTAFSDVEVKAVQIVASVIKQTPRFYTLLHVQCEFLPLKGKYEWAVKLVRQAVNCAPSEFGTWEKLTECYIGLGQYENVSAYLALPDPLPTILLLGAPHPQLMSYFHLQRPRRPETLCQPVVHLPPKGTIVEILLERVKTEENYPPLVPATTINLPVTTRQADPTLLRLPAPGLRDA